MSFLESIADWLDNKSLMAKLGLFLGLVVLISGLYWYFFWSPKNAELKRQQKTLQSKLKKLNKLENIKKDLPKFEKENERLNKEFEIASLKLPKEEEIPALIDSIYADISASGLEPQVFAPKDQVNRDIYAEIPIEMEVSGNYFELATFFDRISRLPRIFNVQNLNLKRIKSKKSNTIDSNLDAKFTTVTFRLLPPRPEGSESKKGKRKNKKKK